MNFIKLGTVLFLLFIGLNSSAQSKTTQSDSLSESKVQNIKKSSLDNNAKAELSAKEKYALKMLKQSYSIKSIQLQTNIDKKRIKEIKKEYIK